MSTGTGLTVEEMESRLATRTSHDEVFRRALMDSPRRTIEAEFNIRIRPSHDVKVTLDGANKPKLLVERREDASELSEADLESVAGGILTWPLPPDWP